LAERLDVVRDRSVEAAELLGVLVVASFQRSLLCGCSCLEFVETLPEVAQVLLCRLLSGRLSSAQLGESSLLIGERPVDGGECHLACMFSTGLESPPGRGGRERLVLCAGFSALILR
jgi:hypothetical protein